MSISPKADPKQREYVWLAGGGQVRTNAREIFNVSLVYINFGILRCFSHRLFMRACIYVNLHHKASFGSDQLISWLPFCSLILFTMCICASSPPGPIWIRMNFRIARGPARVSERASETEGASERTRVTESERERERGRGAESGKGGEGERGGREKDESIGGSQWRE